MPYKDEEQQARYWKDYYERRAVPQRAKSRKYYEEHKEQCVEVQAKWREAHREELRAKAREYYHKTKDAKREEKKQYLKEHYEKVGREQHAKIYKTHKQLVFEHYGSSCACCGEPNPAVLTVDHINNDGAEHRRSLGHQSRGMRMYDWLVKNDFPEGFQILCYNCNCAKPKGACKPHVSRPISEHWFLGLDRALVGVPAEQGER